MQVSRREIAAMLSPAMTLPQISTLIALAAIPVTGQRSHGRGRPMNLYDHDALLTAHAEEASRTIKQFTDNDWIASALLGRQLIHADTIAGELWWPGDTRAEQLGPTFYGHVRYGPERVQAHRVIWIAAEGQIPPAIQINHINRLRWDNRRANLELVSLADNVRHGHGSPYTSYHDAVRQLAELPPPDTMPAPAESLMRAGALFRPVRP